MSMLGTKQPQSYPDGRTKQSFKDETDINKIMQRAQKTGTISHLNKHKGSYADFSDFDFVENLLMLTKGREIFDDLPSEIRNEFGQSQAAFFKYVNDPANVDRLDKLLPGLAAPGRQFVDVANAQPDPVIPDTPAPTAAVASSPPAAPEPSSPPSPEPPEPSSSPT